jgi:hypothetical protein
MRVFTTGANDDVCGVVAERTPTVGSRALGQGARR